MAEITMPRLSDSMEEGTIVRWLKAPGAHVERGEELVEIETDKTTMTHESDAEGALEIVAQQGDTLVVGAVIARIGESAAAGAPTAPEVAPPAEINVSPGARKLARQRGVDLAGITGTGPEGRIVKSDVKAAAAAAGPVDKAPRLSAVSEDASTTTSTVEPGTAKGDVTITEPTRVQQLIARRVAESRATIPTFTLRLSVDMTQCVELRATLRASGADPVPSVNDLVVKACAIALAEHPSANGAYRDGKFERYARVNIGFAVAGEDSLVFPTIFDADIKGLAQIAAEARVLAERARAGTITPPELSGGTFTVSNLGMFGVRSFEAVIVPPQAAILSVGALEPRPVVHDGEVVARRQLDVELACDHRILYGAPAAEFLARVREILEAPLSLSL